MKLKLFIIHSFLAKVSLKFAGCVETCKEIRNNIRKLKNILSDLIETDAGLLTGLRDVDVLTCEQFDDVISQKIQSKKNDRLLDYLLNNYVGDFSEVMKVLEKTDQKHIMNFISSGGGKFT